MTREETKKVLMVIQAAYPNFNPPDKTVTVDTWLAMLENYTYEQVEVAIKAFIRSNTSGFAPNIGQVIEMIQMLFTTNELNEMAAWGLVLKAMRNSIYHAEEEFAKLPSLVQKAVVSPAQLREWAMAEDVDGTWMNVTQSNFMRTYRAELSCEKTLQKLPPDILKLVSKSSEQMPEIQTNQDSLSVSEERKIAEQNATPIPERLKEKYEKLMIQLNGKAV